jgi:hypothetical protein
MLKPIGNGLCHALQLVQSAVGDKRTEVGSGVGGQLQDQAGKRERENITSCHAVAVM